MSNKTYTVRVPAGTSDMGSDSAAQWLEAYMASPRDLVPDPGAGERTLRLSLDKEKVERGAHIAGEPEATFLRRLIASNTPLTPAQDQPQSPKDDPRPKPPLLKGTLKVQPNQARPLVQAFEAGQSFVIRRAFGVPQARKAAMFTEQEREELSSLTSETLNRRAPRVVVENGDLFALTTKLLAIEFRTIEQVRKEAEQIRKQGEQQKQPQAGQPGPGQRSAKPSVLAPNNGTAVGLPTKPPFEAARSESPQGESLESLPYPSGYLG